MRISSSPIDLDGGGADRARLKAAFWGFVLFLLVARLLALFTENVNWDEFALLQRAEISARTGGLEGGGRPGLATLIFIPLAAECVDAVRAIVQGRLLWTLVVAGSAAGFWWLLRGFLGGSEGDRSRSGVSGTGWVAVATGVGLWIAAPDFLRYSIQIRTDQPAILLGLWGGVALLASRRRIGWASLAGLLLGVGFLFTQKLVYVGGLVGVLAAGDHLVRRELRWGREGIRAALAGGVFLLVVLGYRELMARTAGAPSMLPLARGFEVFEYYREYVGYRHYVSMLPKTIPQLLVLGFLLVATLSWVRDRGRHGAQLLVAWGVTVLGVAVVLFHAARFPYFFLVLGLFPATVGALVVGPLMARLESRRERRIAFGAIWIPLVLGGFAQASLLTLDTQRPQRESLAFVQRAFPADARGFENHAVFTCRHDPEPFRVMFYQHVLARFGGDDREEQTAAFLEEFRSRPVQFLILPMLHEPFPQELWAFWRSRYVHYRESVWVAGREIDEEAGWSGTFEAVVGAEYRWLASPDSAGPLEIDGREVAPGQTVVLEAGFHDLFLPSEGRGMLVLALPEPPAPDTTSFWKGF